MAKRKRGPEAAYSCHWCGKPLTLFECLVTADGERVCAAECLVGTLFEGRDRHQGQEWDARDGPAVAEG